MKNSRFITSSSMVVLLIAILSAQPVFAEDKTQDDIRTMTLTLSPADATIPVMTYRLTVPLGDTRRDNAALDYLYAANQVGYPARTDEKIHDKIDEWLNTPLDKLPLDDVYETLACYHHPFKWLTSGAHCRNCQWQVKTEEGFRALLPMLSIRYLNTCLGLKARWQIAKGDFDDAVKTMQTGMSFARHVGNDVYIVQSLVGVSMSRIMLEQIETLIQQPDAPNLYWALTMLPDPMFNWPQAVEYEYATLELQWPMLKELNQRIFSLDEIKRLEDDIYGEIGDVADETKRLLAMRDKRQERLYGPTKTYLQDKGKTPEEIEAMAPAQVVLLYQYQTFCEFRDGVFCWLYVPYAQAADAIRKKEIRLNELCADGLNPFYHFYPSIYRAYFLEMRLQRHIAALRCVEAIRHTAARSGGKLPPSLHDITNVPIPLDPVTDKPFVYRVEGKKAILESQPADQDDSEKILRYEITLR
ncbi:MAG: hypothetical protein JW709_03390 [Sedimentisphaerales bacterium]|nr:hypothetical protein [Sedimentisphaerales bacterium]